MKHQVWADRHNVGQEPTVISSNPDVDNGGFIIATCHGPNARANARIIAMLPQLMDAQPLISCRVCGCCSRCLNDPCCCGATK
jgi:hypothetical protein